jgi:hypothetical protein
VSPVFLNRRIPDFLSRLVALSDFRRLSFRESRIHGLRECETWAPVQSLCEWKSELA